ncbi:uncharacterized protein LOC112126235 [Cimex lectularius]|uniref:Uncharacterized protein n=1 Tax=Cimex lectularius TaxID=79782 RepID=A0A8I6SDF3_CIMLE|nr:uncharacterized protein LOC112126235 [Cimex lectularius]
MTRICPTQECITEFKLNVNPPNFDEFERDPKSTVQKNNVVKDNLSDHSEPERDVEYPRGNPLWSSLKNDYRFINNDMIEDFYVRRKLENPNNFWDTNNTTYLGKKTFPTLMQGMVECLKLAKARGILMTRRFKIDAVDFISEYVYNHDPYYPERLSEPKSIFDIEKFRKLAINGERGHCPTSWDWDREQAAIVLQKNLRGWLVRKRPEVQRVRIFHKALKFPWKVQPTSVYPDNIYDLVEIYPEIHLPNNSRCGLTYEDYLSRKKAAWEEENKKKLSEERIRQFLRKMTISSHADD